jgi:hypothetical protein
MLKTSIRRSLPSLESQPSPNLLPKASDHARLQWGRARPRAETLIYSELARNLRTLQWGRALGDGVGQPGRRALGRCGSHTGAP